MHIYTPHIHTKYHTPNTPLINTLYTPYIRPTYTPLRGRYEKPNEQSELRGNIARPSQLDFPRGCTDVASTSFAPLRNRVDIIGISVDEGESKEGGATDMDL